MEKAIFFSILTILAFLGIHKVMEFVQSIFTLHLKKPVLIMYKASGSVENIEIIVRELASYSKCTGAPLKTAVYIVNDGMDEQTLKVCKQTAEQLDNVFIGDFSDADQLLLRDKKTA